MGQQDQLAFGPLPVEPLSPRRETAGDLSPTRLLVEAVQDTGLSEKEAAISQGYDPRYWPRIKSGEKQAHLERIARLPVRTQQDFITRWARALKLRVTTEESRTSAVAALVEAAGRALREIA